MFRAFSRFAETQRRARIAGAVGGVVVGGTTIAMGVAFADYFGFRPEPFYVLGGVATVLPLLSLFSYSNAERYAREVRAEDPGHSEAESLAMRRNWAHFADTARQQRYFGAGASFVMSALAVGLGIAVLEGAFDMTRDDRTLWGTTLVGLGGGIAASGVSALFVKTPMEAAYEQFEATMPPAPRLNVGIGATAGQVQLSFRF